MAHKTRHQQKAEAASKSQQKRIDIQRKPRTPYRRPEKNTFRFSGTVEGDGDE